MTPVKKDEILPQESLTPPQADTSLTDKNPPSSLPQKEKEIGGPKGLEPTRYGDWERKGIAKDF